VRFERELSQSNRREILMQAAKHLPMQCRTLTGGVLLPANFFHYFSYCECMFHQQIYVHLQVDVLLKDRAGLLHPRPCFTLY